MDEIGIDISRHRTKTFDELEDTSFDLVISLSPEAQHSAVELTRTMDCVVEFWPVFDPTVVEGGREARLEAYREVRDHLLRRILMRFPATPGAQSLTCAAMRQRSLDCRRSLDRITKVLDPRRRGYDVWGAFPSANDAE